MTIARGILLAGIITLGVSFTMMYSAQSFYDRCVPTTGTIVDTLLWHNFWDVSLIPKVQFDDAGGNTIEVILWNQPGRPLTYSIGQVVPVIYDPLDPQNMLLLPSMNAWIQPILVTSMEVFSS
jgi:hypothetical protein